MRHYRERGSGHVLAARKARLNAIVLPPLELPQPSAAAAATLVTAGSGLLEKLLVTKSMVTGDSAADVVAIVRAPDAGSSAAANAKASGGSGGGGAPLCGPAPAPGGSCASDGRVAQLEQNIKYLQEQHQLMLAGLHHEIDCLRHRNRELQFQLVFAKGTNASTPSSPEDDKQKLYSGSPKALNITPLQVEILEKELGEMKLQLQEAECRNVYLSAIVDEQKKKLERYERDRERERERGMPPDPELLRKLDDAEALIRRLRRENSDLRRENANAPAAYQQQPQQQRDYHHQQRSSGPRRRGGNGGGNGGGSGGPNNATAASQSGPSVASIAGGGGGSNGGGGGGGQFRPSWFPPLHTQNYWQQQSRPQPSHADSLPQLQSAGGHRVVYHQQQQQQQQQQQAQIHQGHGRRAGGGGGNNHHHYQHPPNGERKYRGNNQQNRGQKSS